MLLKFPMSEILINRKKHSNSKKLNEKLGNWYYGTILSVIFPDIFPAKKVFKLSEIYSRYTFL